MRETLFPAPIHGNSTPASVSVSVVSAPHDSDLHAELLKHLAPLERSGLIVRVDGSTPGEDLAAAQARFFAADMTLVLLSADFLATQSLNVPLFEGPAAPRLVIPILLRPCATIETPFHRLSTMPLDGSSIVTARNRDEAWADVVSGLRAAVLRYRSSTTTLRSSDVGAAPLRTVPHIPPARFWAPGQDVGPYVLDKLIDIDRGTCLWDAHDAHALDEPRRVAIKSIHGHTSDALLRRMRREFRVLSIIDSPFIVRAIEVLHSSTWECVVLERLRGVPVLSLPKRSITLNLYGALISDALQGLSALHESGIVHRELSPSAFLVVAPPDQASPSPYVDWRNANMGQLRLSTDRPRLKITDLGGVKFQKISSRARTLTATFGLSVLSNEFTAPEVLAKLSSVDHRADIYSIGHLIKTLFVLAAQASRCSPALAEIHRRATSAAPAARFSSAQEMLDAWRALPDWDDGRHGGNNGTSLL